MCCLAPTARMQLRRLNASSDNRSARYATTCGSISAGFRRVPISTTRCGRWATCRPCCLPWRIDPAAHAVPQLQAVWRHVVVVAGLTKDEQRDVGRGREGRRDLVRRAGDVAGTNTDEERHIDRPHLR